MDLHISHIPLLVDRPIGRAPGLEESIKYEFYIKYVGIIPRDNVIFSIVSFQCKHLHEAMKVLALGPNHTMPYPWWKRYLAVISIAEKQVDTIFKHLNAVDLLQCTENQPIQTVT